MKKIYDRRVLVKIDGWKEFEDTSIFTNLRYEDEAFTDQEFNYRFDTFEKAKRAIEEGWVLNAESTTTFFTKKPQIRISTAARDLAIGMTEKNFKPIEVKIVYNEKTNLSITTVANLLNADSFCEYLRDRNISSINF